MGRNEDRTEMLEGKPDPRMAFDMPEEHRVRCRDVASIWDDGENRAKFEAQCRKMCTEEEMQEMWGAVEAWLYHVNHPASQTIVDRVDDAVKDVLPPGSEIIDLYQHGKTSWSHSACIETMLDGELVQYFIKATDNKAGKFMFRGEYEASKALFNAKPDFCPEPMGWGVYKSDPNIYFFVTRFLRLLDEDVREEFPRKVAQLHMAAVAPDGMYGFHVPTGAGLLPIIAEKSYSWEEYFARHTRYLLGAEPLSQGLPPDPQEYQRLVKVLFDRLIPRLLRPLETGGRSIQPRLLHGDLWHGNTGIDDITGETVIFDPCTVWGHHECDLGVWHCPGVQFHHFVDTYYSYMERSAPVEDYDGRTQLYLMSFEIRASVSIVGNPNHRNEFLRHIAELDAKYPETYDEWAKARGEEPCEMKKGPSS